MSDTREWERARLPWRVYPDGTEARDSTGSQWTKTPHGWKADGGGGLFQYPGAAWEVRIPVTPDALCKRGCGLPAASDGLCWGDAGPCADLQSSPPPDDPALDATDFAHPAWWRGNAHGVDAACDRLSAVLDGDLRPPFYFGSAKLSEVATRIAALRPSPPEGPQE